MRSSTFSFDRANAGFGVKPVAFGLIFGVLVLLVIEYSWRQHGATPGYVDSKPRWSWVRSQVSEQQGVVLLGASRMHFGFSLAAFRDRYPGTPVHQLAVAGSWPYASLRDLARDEDYRGLTLISFTPDIILPFRHEDQTPYVDHYRKRWNIDVLLNFLAGSLAEKLMVTRHHNYGINTLAQSLVRTGNLPASELYLATRFDREIDADYSMEDIEQHQIRRVSEATSLYDDLYPISTDRWRSELSTFLEYVRTINDRGGCVIAIRFPSQGTLYQSEQQLFPKHDFWSVLEATPYLGTVHFDDINDIEDFDLPDYQHVDESDKYEFTVALLDKIEQTAASIVDGGCAIAK